MFNLDHGLLVSISVNFSNITFLLLSRSISCSTNAAAAFGSEEAFCYTNVYINMSFLRKQIHAYTQLSIYSAHPHTHSHTSSSTKPHSVHTHPSTYNTSTDSRDRLISANPGQHCPCFVALLPNIRWGDIIDGPDALLYLSLFRENPGRHRPCIDALLPNITWGDIIDGPDALWYTSLGLEV